VHDVWPVAPWYVPAGQTAAMRQRPPREGAVRTAAPSPGAQGKQRVQEQPAVKETAPWAVPNVPGEQAAAQHRHTTAHAARAGPVRPRSAVHGGRARCRTEAGGLARGGLVRAGGALCPGDREPERAASL